MTRNKLLTIIVAVFVLAFADGCHVKQKSINEMALKAQRDAVLEKYFKVPHDEILQQISGNRLYTDLMEAYKTSLINLKNETDNDCAKLIVVILTPEVGKSMTLANTYGIPFILKTCDNLGVDFVNLSDSLASKDLSKLTQLPDEGGWTKAGASYVADQLAALIMKYDTVRSSRKPIAGDKPHTFGDMRPNENEIVDGDKNLPYHVKVNADGLRMDYNVGFPKKKQRILILGDGQIFNPFLDQEFIATSLLQKRFPEKEIINASMLNYTMDDYESLYKEKARYTEPDIVLVCTNGGDILDEYFTQRNHYSRRQKIYPGTDVEKSFYYHLYGDNN